MDDEEIERLQEILENNRAFGGLEHNDSYDREDFVDEEEDYEEGD